MSGRAQSRPNLILVKSNNLSTALEATVGYDKLRIFKKFIWITNFKTYSKNLGKIKVVFQ